MDKIIGLQLCCVMNGSDWDSTSTITETSKWEFCCYFFGDNSDTHKFLTVVLWSWWKQNVVGNIVSSKKKWKPMSSFQKVFYCHDAPNRWNRAVTVIFMDRNVNYIIKKLRKWHAFNKKGKKAYIKEWSIYWSRLRQSPPGFI